MEKRKTIVLKEIADYYSTKLAEHGETPYGVDWNGEEGQLLRFKQLSKIIGKSCSFTVNDLGCGYGALYDYLNSIYHNFVYNGCDVSGDMIHAAKNRYPDNPNVCLNVASEPPEAADYGIASGIFNVRLGRSDEEWQDYLECTLDILDHTSTDGFAFNCLTSYSDTDKKRSYLYYADPCALFNLCKRRYSRNVALMHDYGLYEFTILVRKKI